MGSEAPSQQGGPQNIFSRVYTDIKAMNTSIMVITQKLNAMVRYEKILGRNLIVLNKKLKDLEDKGIGPSVDVSGFASELGEINRRLNENAEALARIQSDLEYVKQNYAKAEDIKEIKYVVGSINPLEFVTAKDVQEIVSGAKKK